MSSTSPTAAEELLAGFVFRTVDAMVRRCMEDDELTHLLMSTAAREPKPMLLWLRGLVAADGGVHATSADCERLHQMIATWTSALESPMRQPRYITGFHLHAPVEAMPTQLAGLWRLTIHLVARDDPSQVFNAVDLYQGDH